MTQVAGIMLKQHSQKHMLTLRRTIDFFEAYASFMGEAISELDHLLEANCLLPASGPIVCFYNADLSALDVEIGFEVAKPVKGTGKIMYKKVPSRLTAVTIDRGPYEKQDPTLEALMAWVSEHGLTPAGGICYHYLNDESQPENEFLTEMFIPVERIE